MSTDFSSRNLDFDDRHWDDEGDQHSDGPDRAVTDREAAAFPEEETLAQAMARLQQHMPADRTVVAGNRQDVVESMVRAAPFLAAGEYAKVTGNITEEHVRDRNVFGALTMGLEAAEHTVTRHDMRVTIQARALKDARADHTYTPDQIDSLSSGELVTYRVDEIPMSRQEILASNPTFVTRHSEQVTDWRQQGLIPAHQPVRIVLNRPADIGSLNTDSLDENTSVVFRQADDGTANDWKEPLPHDALLVHGHVNDQDVPELNDDRHVVGNLPPHLRERARYLTSSDYDHVNRQQGPSRTYRTTILMRTPTRPAAG